MDILIVGRHTNSQNFPQPLNGSPESEPILPELVALCPLCL